MKQTVEHCRACGGELQTSAKFCPHCGAKMKKLPVWAIALAVVLVVAAVGIAFGKPVEENGTNGTVGTGNNAFSGDCGITASAQMGKDILGLPMLTVNVNNITSKEIAAIQFYAVPLNVYGEEITGIFAQNNLYTDDSIVAGKSASCSWQFLDSNVKTVKLYVYSVYFSDGTEWGDKDATRAQILKNGLLIQVDGES